MRANSRIEFPADSSMDRIWAGDDDAGQSLIRRAFPTLFEGAPSAAVTNQLHIPSRPRETQRKSPAKLTPRHKEVRVRANYPERDTASEKLLTLLACHRLPLVSGINSRDIE